MLNFAVLEKGLELVSILHFVFDHYGLIFQEKSFSSYIQPTDQFHCLITFTS